MANSTYKQTRAVALTDFLDVFRKKTEQYAWDWRSITNIKNSTRATEQVYSIGGLPVAQSIGEGSPMVYADLSQQAVTTFTMTKYGIGTTFTKELLDDNLHIKDFVSEAAEAAAESLDYVVDLTVAQGFNRAFNSSFTVFDGVELCGTHTVDSGDTVDNALTAATLGFSSLWDAVDAFELNLVTESGIPLRDTPFAVLANPSNRRTLEKLLNSTYEPDTTDRQNNTLNDKGLKAMYCRYLDISGVKPWFVLGNHIKRDHCFFWREKPTPETDDDFDRSIMKLAMRMRFDVGFRHYLGIQGNPGL